MNALIRVTLALAAGALACPLFAADTHARLSPEVAAAHASAGAAVRARLAKMMAGRTTAVTKAGATVDLVNPTPLPGPRLANAFRAYPPSCAADPLPDITTAPLFSAPVNLYATDGSGNPANAGTETVTVTVWRLPCSSSGNITPYNTDGGSNAITLMRIDRDSAFEGDDTFYPTFPLLSSDQGSFTGNFVRAALEPNTVISEAYYDTPIINSTTYVLENYPVAAAGETLYNYDFDLIINPNTTAGDIVTLTVDGFPNRDNTALPIDGYMSGTWYDPAHGGEGMLVQIIDNGDNATRTFFGAWFTYDDLGVPFWLSVQGTFTNGSTSVNATGYYQTGGGFAGNFTPPTTQNTWGTLSFNFTSCTTMNFTFNGSTPTVTFGPDGSGSRVWHRLADTNGMNCE